MSSYGNHHPATPILRTRIPEEKGAVSGLTYGAHVSLVGAAGYHVSLDGGQTWAIARMTPADDELLDSDAEIVDAIAAELASEPEAGE